MAHPPALVELLENLKSLSLLLKDMPHLVPPEMIKSLLLTLNRIEASPDLPAPEEMEILYEQASHILHLLAHLRDELGEKIQAAPHIQKGLTQYAKITQTFSSSNTLPEKSRAS